MTLKNARYNLHQDRTGMYWDLLLYVPTVGALSTVALFSWYNHNTSLAYLMVFLASFFLIAGANRILKTRLMILGSAPVSLEIRNNEVTITLKNHKTIDLLKEVRLYSDLSGKTFGLSGLNAQGMKEQFIFHRGQFALNQEFEGIITHFKKAPLK